MLSRRHFSLALAGSLAAPSLLRAQQGTDEIRDLAVDLDQLHSIQIRRGDETLLAEAPRGPGLTRVANIKSCSKSVLALILGAVYFGVGFLLLAMAGSDRAPAAQAPRQEDPSATEHDGLKNLVMAFLAGITAGQKARR